MREILNRPLPLRWFSRFARQRNRWAVLWMVVRLSVSSPLNAVFWRLHLPRFFPPPRKTVYRKALADYFFRN